MIRRRNRKLSVARQCELVGMSRSSWYYRPRGESERNRALMRVIDRLYLEMPWYGPRQMTRELRRAGHRVGRKRVRRLMRLMGLRSVAPRPFTSRRAPGHVVYPYLLDDIRITRVNQAWCADLTYIPMAYGFLYVVAIMDWHSQGPGLAAVQHARHRVLRRSSGRSHRTVWLSRDLQHRSGQPVHQHHLDQCSEASRRPDLDGR